MNSPFMIVKWVVLLICCVGLGACRSSAPVTHRSADIEGTEKVLVLPIQDMVWLHGSQMNVRSPLTGKVFMTGPVSKDADRILTDLLITALREQTAFKTVPSREAHDAMAALKSAEDPYKSPIVLLAQIGRMSNADLVLQGYLYRFKERQGTKYSAESTASVAFDVYLIDCNERKLVWSGYFDETQQALTDDLRFIGTFFKRGGRWLTAEEMAREAMTDMFKEFKIP